MKYLRGKNDRRHRTSQPRASRGIALITAMLLVSLFVAMTLAMTIAATSDTLITKFYRNERAAFYAADSGVNVARQYMLNQLASNALAVGAQFAANGTPPLSSTDAGTTLTNALAHYNSASPAANRQITVGDGTNSWPASFYIVQNQSGTIGTSLGTGSPATYSSCTPVYSGTPTNAAPYNCTNNLPQCTGANCATFAITDFQYTFPYTVTAIGQARANEQQVVEDAGNLIINVHVAASNSTKQSFAAYGTFIDQYTECSVPFAPGTLTGPFFTNGAWTYTDTGSYTFTGKVGSVSSTFGYSFGNNCYESSNPQYKSGSNTIAPTYQAGYNLGAPAVPLPANDFNQKEAVVDGVGDSWGANNYSAAQQYQAMNMALLTVDGNTTPYPATGTTTPGVYMAYTSSGGTNPTYTMTGGGIYVEGSASSVMLSTANPVVNGTTQLEQVFTITQAGAVTTNVGSPVTSGSTTVQTTTTTTPTITTTITVDPTGNVTTVAQTTNNAISAVTTTTTTTTSHGRTHTSTSTSTSNSSSSSTNNITINGVPENDSSGAPSPATMLYVDGTIGNSSNTGLSGPGQGQPAIQNGSAVTVTAAGNIDVTGDILYKTEPVTTTQNQIVTGSSPACCNGTPADTLIPGNNNGQVLGLFTATGNIAMYNQQSNGNIEIDASLAMISQGGSGGWVNDGNAIKTITVVGGRIANQAMVCNCTTRNIYFDQRFAQGGFAPPWYPSTTIATTSTDSVTAVTTAVTRTQWLNVF